MVYSMHNSAEDPWYHPIVIKQDQQSWKRILIIDDNEDVTTTFKAGLEYSNINTNRKIKVYTCNNPLTALSAFKPNFYDLLLIDIEMPDMNGFELSEKILAIDLNVKVCYMSCAEINREALSEIYPAISIGCFIRKPVTMDYLIKRIMSQLY